MIQDWLFMDLEKKDRHIYFVISLAWTTSQKVCVVLSEEFTKTTIKVIEDAIQELESCTHVFEENGIKEYQKMINDYRRLLKKLRDALQEAEWSSKVRSHQQQ